jgi:alpha-2-macroglobulin
VEPVANVINLSLEHEQKKLPGTTLKIKITMTDWKGKGLDGEVALWMVDKAVLSLGTEQPLDPLSPFIEYPESWLRIRDTRNLVFGNLPVEEIAGGDGMYAKSAAEMEAMREMFERTTVRKNFKTVAYFNPSIPVKGGTAEIEVQLPDNLTDFAIRAVATSGYDKLGAARSVVSVRLPVIVQSALPRFVRPMDSFSAGGIGRVVEGDGGPGLAGITVEGLTLEGRDPAKDARNIVLDPKKAERLVWPMKVPDALSEIVGSVVAISLYVQRTADLARDAFRIELPVRNDVDTRRMTDVQTMDGTKAVAMPEPKEGIRKGTAARTIVAARDPRLISVIEGLNYLSGYAHGCLEQRISKLYPSIMLKDLLESSGIPKFYPVNETTLKDFFAYMASCQDTDGLFGFWPGSTGYVSMTAYAVEFLVSCRDAKISFDPALLDRAKNALRQALRSDYRRLLSGWSTYERVEALAALDIAGTWDEGYANDLLSQSETLGLYSQARLYAALKRHNLSTTQKGQVLEKRLIGSIIVKKEGTREVYAGLQLDQSKWWGGIVLGSPIRTVSAMLDALYRADPKSTKVGMLADYLVSQSGDEGWGNTSDNVSAMKALKTVLTAASSWTDATLEVSSAQGKKQFSMAGKGLGVFKLSDQSPVTITAIKGVSKSQPLTLLMYTDYQPAVRGTLTKAENLGFAVDRELIEIDADGSVAKKNKAVAGLPITLALDTVVEEHVTVVNFENRNFVAVTAPIAAGFEPLNPKLAGAPREAAPSGSLTMAPTYSLYADDRVVFYYDTLPKGTYHFYFRVRASFSGSFTEPAAGAELMYNLGVRGRSDGAEVKVLPDSGK